MSLTIKDPIQALMSWATANLYYVDDDGITQSPTTTPPGMDIIMWLDEPKHIEGVPRLVVGPISATPSRPFNIGSSPNSRWDYQSVVELHLQTMKCASPNIGGYTAKLALTEVIQDALVQHQTDIDGTGTYFLTLLQGGPRDAMDSDPSNDAYHVIFLVNVRRQKVR